VTTPGGEQWRVRRLFTVRLGNENTWGRLRRRARVGGRFVRGVGDATDAGCAADLVSDLPMLLAFIIVLVILSLLGVPLLLAVVDLIVIVLLTVLAISARVLFRRPWIVEATSPTTRATWRVVGWRASGRAVDDAAEALAHEHPLPAGAEIAAIVDPSPAHRRALAHLPPEDDARPAPPAPQDAPPVT
jgi:hypothetical protein